MTFSRLAILFLSCISLAASDRQVINVGTLPNDNTGDSIRTAMQKVNNNFSAIWPSGTNAPIVLSSLGAIPFAESYSHLREFDETQRTNSVLVLGGHGINDGGDGVFYWQEYSTDDDNGGTIIAPTGVSTGRWIRVFSGPVSVKWFGALGDGESDDASAIQPAINSVTNTGGSVYFPVGTYLIGSTITIDSDKEVTLFGESSINNYATNTGSVLYLADQSDCNMLEKSIEAKVNLKGLLFYGNKDNQTSTNLYGLWLKGSSDTIYRCTVEDVIVRDVSGTGIQNDNRETRFYRIGCSYNLNNGLVNTASSDVTIKDILAGFNGGAGIYGTNANSMRLVCGDLYRNGVGLWLLNCNNNEFVGLKTDANEREGVLLQSTNGTFCYRNHFLNSSFNNNNFYLNSTTSGATNPWPSGTWSNVRLVGDNTIETTFAACNFWEYEGYLTPPNDVLPKYGLEDARGYYVSNGIEGAAIALLGSSFKSTNTWMAEGAYPSNVIHNAVGHWFVDGGSIWRDDVYYRQLRANQMRVTDQNESDLGLQVNGYYYGTNWLYRANGPAFMFRARTDNPMLGLQYAPTGTAGAALTWTSAINVNSTNGYVAVANGDTPAVTPFEVVGTAKSTFLETRDGMALNAYYSSGWKRRASGAAYFVQTAANGVDQWVLNITPTAAADSAISWTPAITISTNGIVAASGVTITAGGGGLNLPGQTASTLTQLDGTKTLVSIANAAGALVNDGSGGFSYKGIAATIDVLVAGGTTNRQVFAGGVLISNITNFYSP